MRTLALFVLGVLLVQAEISQRGYESGREYVYEYEGQLLTGVPKTSQEYSGLKIKCKPILQFRSDNKVVMQLDEISLHRLQREVEDPKTQQPLEKFQRITGEESETFQRELRKPIRFTYRQGKITDLETSRDDPTWSVNSKRAITDLLQLNLDERDSLDEDRNINRHSAEGRTGEVKMLRVKEEGISGKCESVYQIRFDTTDVKVIDRQASSSELEPMTLMNITKIRNLENCDDRRMHQKSILSGMIMNQEKREQEPLIKSLREIRYNVSGNQQEFLIESIVSEGQHIFTPYNDKVSNVVTFVNQTMRLTKTDSIRTQIEMPRDTIKERTLRYEFPEKKQLREKTMEQIEQEQRMTPEELRRQRKDDVKELLRMIVESFKYEVVGEEIPAQFVHMVQKLRDLNKEDIEEIYNEVVKRDRSQETKDEERQRKLFMDALPLINTRECIKFIKEKIQTREIEGEFANQVLNTIALIHDPSIHTLDDVLELCKHEKVVEQKEVRKTCWLSLGSMVNSAFGKDKHSKIQIQLREIKQQLTEERSKVMTTERRERIQELERRLIEARDNVEDAKKRYTKNLVDGIKPDKSQEEQIMCLRAIGNSALVDTIQEVQSIIDSVHTKDEMKVHAIYALRRIAPQVPSKVRNILSSVYHNQENSPEIRIASYVVIMDSNVTTPIMQLFAQSLHKERSQQVGSFVFSHLKTLSNSTNPMEKKKAEGARYALRFAKPITPGAQYSKNMQLAKQMENLDMGITTEINTIGSPKSFLPRSANAKVSANVLGYNMHVMETGFRAEGLQTIVEKIFGPEGSLWRKNSMLDLLKRKARSVSTVEKEKKLLKDSLPIEPRKPEEPKGSMYVKIFGNELRFWTFDKDTVKSILEEGTVSIKDIEEKLKEKRSVELQKVIMLADITQQIPTELGLPLQVNVTSAALVNMKVEGRGRVEPALFESERRGEKPSAIIAEVDVLSKIALNIEGKVGVDAHVLRCGVGLNTTVNSTIPFNSQVHFDLKNRKYETLFKTLETEREIVNVKSKPYTFCVTKEYKPIEQREEDLWDTLWEIYDSSTATKTVERRHDRVIMGKLIHKQPITKQWRYGKEEFGIETEISTKYMSRKNVPEAPMHPLCGPVEMNITLRPGNRRPQEIEVELSLQDVDAKESEEHFERHNKRQSISIDESRSQSRSRSSEESKEENTDRWDITKDSWEWKSASFESETKSREQRRSQSSESSERPVKSHHRSQTQGRNQEHRDIEQRLNEIVRVKKVILRVTARRDNTEENRQMIAELHLDTKDKQYKGFHLELMRSPIKDQEQKPWKMCMQGEAEYPREEIDTVQKLAKYLEDNKKERTSFEEDYSYFGRPASNPRSNPSRPNEPREDMKQGDQKQIRAKLTVQWGESCENDKKVEIKTRIEKTKEQVREEREQNTPEYKQCEEDRRNHKPYSRACNDLIKKLTELRKVDIEITHEKLTKIEKSLYSKTMLMAQYYLWDNLRIDNVEIDNPYHKVLITAELSENQQEANVTVNHPFENLKFERVRLPTKVQPMSTRKTMVEQYMNYFMTEQYTPFCKIRGNEIRTFDNVTYKYDLTKCEHYLAKDCSEEERFSVLTAKKHHDSDKKITKIFVEDKKVELIPEDDKEDMLVRLDSVPQELKVSEKMTIRKNGEVRVQPLEDRQQQRRVESITRRKMSSEYMSSNRQTDREECEQLRSRRDRYDELTFEEEQRLLQCERRSSSMSSSSESSEKSEVSRQECEEIRRLTEQGVALTREERDKLRRCESKMSSSECDELKQRIINGERLNSQETDNFSRCKSQRRSSESVSRETYTNDRYRSTEISRAEERHWNSFERLLNQEISRSQEVDSREQEEDRTNPIEIIVIRHHDNRMEVIAPKFGLKIKTDGINTKVEMSQFYRSKQCGLCGNFDGEKENEFEGPNREVYRDAQQFGLSYQIPSSKCAERAACIPRMRNVIVHKVIDRVDMTCFSKTPVSQCITDEGCRPEETRQESLDYHCVETDQQSTRDLVALGKTGVINKVTRKRTTFSEVADVHRSCRAF
ncbi:vitellogenin-3-like [Glandiceps talaboti]